MICVAVMAGLLCTSPWRLWQEGRSLDSYKVVYRLLIGFLILNIIIISISFFLTLIFVYCSFKLLMLRGFYVEIYPFPAKSITVDMGVWAVFIKLNGRLTHFHYFSVFTSVRVVCVCCCHSWIMFARHHEGFGNTRLF